MSPTVSENISGHACTNSGNNEIQKELEDAVYETATVRRDKREVSPSSSVGSGGDRLRKKRKSLNEEAFGGDEVEKTFNKGKMNDDSNKNKKKVGRKSVTKAKEVARRVGVVGLGENKEGVSDIYKEYHKKEGNKNEIFRFGSTKDGEVDSSRCILDMEQVKEVGGMIGVSWSIAEEEKKRWTSELAGNKGDVVADEQRVWGKRGKKIGLDLLLRTRNRISLDYKKQKVIEGIWGGKGYGFSQLPANGNSGVILLIWDTKIFTCKEAVGDERFIAIKGLWKGKLEEIFLVCIYGPHISQQKASLWDRLAVLMDRWRGAWCIFGDLNVVRSYEDRFNSQVNAKEMNDFNEFINDTRLIIQVQNFFVTVILVLSASSDYERPAIWNSYGTTVIASLGTTVMTLVDHLLMSMQSKWPWFHGRLYSSVGLVIYDCTGFLLWLVSEICIRF
ncbi:RNA-directed DNA polymerase, eukaryota, Reverse transcriptase zinc-binding domain protein [Artemisia annua]|uniref:RNA-directed DNA polymerase, eukaryota, Reverse transcriptase zinc-binding domain protein n=1 Tax=Artemisia annua TaxID=35608 RepID=A0A2U1MMR0_ARTAN|nr:RNA-directed DNA polymerase, eukaryota, Reverse transcriptase zinc-binding domain protein [Artemisia annua]